MVTLSKTRIEALSDGVFSIAMTLLVLKLEVPEYHHSNDEMLRQLLALQPRMFVSLLPFSAGLMGHLLMHPVSQVFYFGNQLTIALLLNLHWQYALRKGFTVDAADAGVRASASHMRRRFRGVLNYGYTWAVSYSFCWPD